MSLDGLIRVRLGQWAPIARLRRPLQEFLQYTFPNASSPDALQEQTTERLLSQLRPHIQNLLASEEDTNGRSGSRVDVCATIESLIARHARDILRILFDNGWYLNSMCCVHLKILIRALDLQESTMRGLDRIY